MSGVYAMCCVFTPSVMKGRIPMQVDIGIEAMMMDEILWNIFGFLAKCYGVWVDAWCSISSIM